MRIRARVTISTIAVFAIVLSGFLVTPAAFAGPVINTVTDPVKVEKVGTSTTITVEGFDPTGEDPLVSVQYRSATGSAHQISGYAEAYYEPVRISYTGTNVGHDIIEIRVGNQWVAMASRTWYSGSVPPDLPPTPVLEGVQDPVKAERVGSQTEVHLYVTNGFGAAFTGYIYGQTTTGSANTWYDSIYVTNGNGVARYTGNVIGEDVLEFGVNGRSLGYASRSWYAETVQELDYTIQVVDKPVDIARVGTSTTFNVLVRDATGNPWTGGLPWRTTYPLSQNERGGTINVQGGAGSAAYVGYGAGQDTIELQTADGKWLPLAERVWYTTDIVPPISSFPLIHVVENPFETERIGTNTEIKLVVRDEFGNPISGLVYVRTVAGSANGFNGWVNINNGKGSAFYTGNATGSDVLEFQTASGWTPLAARQWTADGEPSTDFSHIDADLATPPGQVLVVAANVLQGNAADKYSTIASGACGSYFKDDPDYTKLKVCDAAGRRQNFAERIDDLAHKILDDGMGFVPDVVTVNETHEFQANDIAAKLSAITGFPYELATHSQRFTGNPYGTADLRKDAGIIYNSCTMAKRAGDSAGDFVDSVPSDTSEKYKRHVVISLQESDLCTGLPTGAVVAVASVHFVTGAGYANQSQVEPDKAAWVRQVVTKLESRYGGTNPVGGVSAAIYAIGGDFNAIRCDGLPTSHIEPQFNVTTLDYKEPTLCSVTDPVGAQQEFYSELQARGFEDTVFLSNAASPANTPGQFDAQYKDGYQGKRPNRIDFIFAKGASTDVGSSFDLTCGEDYPSSSNVRRRCTWLQNPDYYSDHRLVWALLGANVKPTVLEPEV